MEGFSEGYLFFVNNSSAFWATLSSADYVKNISEYNKNVSDAITKLIEDLNGFNGNNKSPSQLKGDVAEFWHGGTYNINAVINGSSNYAEVLRSNEFGSPDIISSFGSKFGLKYYKTGVDSAKEQSKTIFEKYKSNGGKDSIEEFITKKGFEDTDSVLNEPIYVGQVRIIPKDQMEEAISWLKRKIAEEQSIRPKQVKRYQETLKLLSDRIKDSEGVESIPLSVEDAEYLAELAKKGEINEEVLKKIGISMTDFITYRDILSQAFKSGLTAATISIVLNLAPEVYKAIVYLIKSGKIDSKQFQKIGFAALQGGAEGFIRGAISAAITTACKSGLWGTALKSIDPSVIGLVTVLAIDTMKNSFMVATGKMQSRELINDLIKEMFISTCSLIGGGITQAIINELPVFGFMLGSFLGSVIGSFTYNVGYNAFISFCIDTGFTMFGLVDQNYELPDEVMEAVGFEVFRYEDFGFEEFNPETFSFEEFRFEEFEYESLSIGILRRGVIAVHQIGYI